MARPEDTILAAEMPHPTGKFSDPSPGPPPPAKIARMRCPLILSLIVPAALVAGLGVVLLWGGVPLGIPGQWEWLRLRAEARPSAADLAPALVATGAYAGLAALGWRSLSRREGRGREGA